MADFQYKTGGSWVDVPDYAHPDDTGAIQVTYPPATERDGVGTPCGAIGLPKIVIRGGMMRGDGWNWWQAFFSSATALSASMTGITAYNPHTGAWAKYTGTLLRPEGTCRPGSSAGNTLYRDITIIIERIASTT